MFYYFPSTKTKQLKVDAVITVETTYTEKKVRLLTDETDRFDMAHYGEWDYGFRVKSLKKRKELQMRQFHIHHATGPKMFSETEVQPRDYVGFVHATSLENAFKLTQGDINPEWDERSTSVGDIIQDGTQFYMVCGVGFKLLFETGD